MALRSLDNALPASVAERPKKPAAKAATPTAEAPRDSPQNDENSPLPLQLQPQPQPAKAAEQAVEYVASDDLEPLPNPESKIAVSHLHCWILGTYFV